MWRTRPVASALGPTMMPGVSTSETIGMPNASQSCRKRAALSAASLVIAPAMCIVLLAMTPTGRPSMRANAVTSSGAKRSRRNGDRALVGERLDDRLDLVGAPLALGDELAQPRLVRPRPGGRRALEVAEQPLGDRDRLGLVGDDDVDHAVGRLHVDRPDVVGVDVAEAAARDHRRAAHAERRVLGRDDQVRAAGDHGVAGEAAALDDRDPRDEARQPRPQRERARVERRDDRVVGVARAGRRRPRRRTPSAAACARSARTAGPSCGGRARPGCRPAPCSRRRAPRRRPARRTARR